MCQTSEGTREENPFTVLGGERIPESEVKIFQVWYRKSRADMASALRHFVAHHLKGREVTSFSLDSDPKWSAHPLDVAIAEYATLVIMTTPRQLRNNGDM